MAIARVRVETREYRHGDYDSEKAFRSLFARFKKECIRAGVLRDYKRHEEYESKGQKRRRKERESEVQRLKAKIRGNFSEQPKRKEFDEYQPGVR